MSPVKSGSAKTCALIVNVQGAARRTGKEGEEDRPWSGAERASCYRRDRECGEGKQRDDNREQSVAAELVRSIGEELRAPLLIGPVASEPEHGQLVCARKAVLDDLAARESTSVSQELCRQGVSAPAAEER